jgi:hypothetical protein
MRFRSTGLGTSELRGGMKDLSPAGKDLLVLRFKTVEPVEWEMKAGLEYHDILSVLKRFFKPSVLFFVLRCLFYVKKNPEEPEDIMDKSIG